MVTLTSEQKGVLEQSIRILSGVEVFTCHESSGKGCSERVIETPWVAQYVRGCNSLLDIGFTFASYEYLGLLLELKNSYGVTVRGADIIKPEKVVNRYPSEWLESILDIPVTIGDIRYMVLPENEYDVVTCISTLEHIGFDMPATTVEGSSFERHRCKADVKTERDSRVNQLVLDAVHTTLKPGGSLLVSVPMGQGGPVLVQDSLGFYCAQWEYEANSWNELISHEGYDVADRRFFGITREGWQEVAYPGELKDRSSDLKPHAEGVAVCVLKKVA